MRPTTIRPLLRFLALSAVIHALVLSPLGPVPEVKEPSAPTVLSAELVTRAPHEPPAAEPPAAKPLPPKAPATVRPAPRPDGPRRLPAPVAADVPAPFPAVEDESQASVEAQDAKAAEAAAGEPPGETAPEIPPVAQAEEPPGAAAASAAAHDAARTPIRPVRDLPRSGSVSYELFLGDGRLHIGRTVQSWSIGERTYRLSSASETTGLAGFFRPYQLDYVSEGRVDAAGFHPESFSVRRGRNGSRQYAVRFDWGAKELTLGPVAAPRKVALPDGTLDVLSFIYQLRRAELAPGRFELHVTTGNRLEAYTVEIGAEEPIELPAGTVRALPVRQIRKPGQESMEIWLAPDRQYLPVRIRFFDRNGEISGEQLAADIAFQ